MEKIRIVIADDHSLVRKGIRDVLEEFPDLEVVAEAEDGIGVFNSLTQTHPDCLLIDITMPNFEPITAVRQIRALYPAMKILVISAYDDDIYVQGLLAAGVDGYHLKAQPLAELRLAIERVLKGEKWLSSPLVNKLIHQTVSPKPVPPLTTRQCDLLRLLQQGLDNKAIAANLNISVKTVENSLTRLYRYINVQSRLEALNFIIQHPDLIETTSEKSRKVANIFEFSSKKSISVLLVDDNANYRHELHQSVSLVNPQAVVYEAENISEAVHLTERVSPQLVFVDMILDRESGIQCTHQIINVSPKSRIILISAYPDREFRRQGLEAGAVAFLDKKDLDIASLRQVIANVAR